MAYVNLFFFFFFSWCFLFFFSFRIRFWFFYWFFNFSFSIIFTINLIITGYYNINSFTDPINYETEIIPINNSTGIEKSNIQMNISTDNISWGFVDWTIQNHVSTYLIIIQIFDNDEFVLENNYGAIPLLKLLYIIMILTNTNLERWFLIKVKLRLFLMKVILLKSS